MLLKVLKYLRTCYIFYLINEPSIMFGIIDRHMLKKGILSYQTTKFIRNEFTKFLKLGPNIRIFWT